MVQIIFTDADGIARAVAEEPGTTLMQAAKTGGVPGIDAECGGCCACATCGVVVADAWFDLTGPAGEIEASMLECCRANGPRARLSCQIVITPAMDGLSVITPDRQQ